MTREQLNGVQIVVFDGICNLCHGGVNFIIEHDVTGEILFSAAQTPAGEELQALAGVDALDDETFLFIDRGRVFVRAKAATRLFRYFSGGWRLLSVLHYLPAFLLDPLYRYVARNRYRWYGKKSSCMLPSPELESRFLLEVSRES